MGEMTLVGEMTEAQTGKNRADSWDCQDARFMRLRLAFWFISGITGFLQIWLQDYAIFGDTLSYLDSGDMLWRGDFRNAITPIWSPGLPFLLGLVLKILHPVGLWEVAAVKLVDLLIFIFVLGAFDYLVSQFCRYHERNAATEYPAMKLRVPRLALATVGYLLFLWTITQMLPACFALPDMFVMGIVFMIFGLLLKIRTGATGFASFAILGLVLGCGYLIKAPLFPLAFMFLSIAFLLVGDSRKAVPRVALAFGIFALIAAPLVWELSVLTGSLSFGKSGAWNYARTVDGVTVAFDWHGQPEGSGTPLHPTRILFQMPTVYEFGSPVLGTYPPWRDPYYWFAGITPHFELAGQWRVVKENTKILMGIASGLNRSFVYGFLILLFMSSDLRLVGKIVAKQWFLILPALATIGMFMMVLVEGRGRYIAPYPIVMGFVLFSSVAIVGSAPSLKLVNRSVLLALALFAASSVKPAASEFHSFGKSLHRDQIMGRGGPWHTSTLAMSDAVSAYGLQRGDKVAYVGEGGDFYWARLAGLQVNAEIRQFTESDYAYALATTGPPGLEPSVDIYWAAAPEVKEKIDRILYKAGSKAIVTDAFPAGNKTTAWNHIPGTVYFIHMLSDNADSDSKATLH